MTDIQVFSLLQNTEQRLNQRNKTCVFQKSVKICPYRARAVSRLLTQEPSVKIESLVSIRFLTSTSRTSIIGPMSCVVVKLRLAGLYREKKNILSILKTQSCVRTVRIIAKPVTVLSTSVVSLISFLNCSIRSVH